MSTKGTDQKRSVLSQSWQGISGVDLNTRPKISICGVMFVWMISDVYITSKCNCMGILSLVPLGLLFNDLSTGINLSVFLYRFISFRWYHKNKSIASKKIFTNQSWRILTATSAKSTIPPRKVTYNIFNMCHVTI